MTHPSKAKLFVSKLHLKFENVGKKFYQRWLFRGVSHDFAEKPHLALVGTNGSGKSTLMRIIAGQLNPSEGKVQAAWEGKPLPLAQLYRHLSWAGPYLDLYPELTFREQVALHFRLKACLLDSQEELIALLELEPHQDKPLQWYSSGMLQRAKVGLALFTRSHLLLLDEPTSNMDQHNANRILDLIARYTKNRLWVLASNLPREYERLDEAIYLSGK